MSRTRITIKFLNAQVEMLNRIQDTPQESYVRKDGRNIAQPGNYHISGAYGGYSLHQMSNEGGGVRDVFRCGHIPARELSERISAYVRGLEEGAK